MLARDWFIQYYHTVLRNTDLFGAMLGTVEESSWHREANVLVHTDMVVSHHLSNSSNVWNSGDVCVALACAFHDVGKPRALQWKESAERGKYKTFGGHELLSARLWENYAAANWKDLSQFLAPYDIFRVAWLIEHHLPYRIEKPAKVELLMRTLHEWDNARLLSKVLLADCWGRISDDHDNKKNDVLVWQREFYNKYDNFQFTALSKEDSPTMTMLIGASGSGKSTYVGNTHDQVFSLDALRHEFYGDDYGVAFTASCEDKEFSNKANQRFSQMVKTKEHLIIDNTNISTKRRRFYIEQARRAGYAVNAVLFPVSLDTIIARQQTRGDKSVPTEAVVRQYMGLQMPSYGEFDAINVNSNNLTQ